MKLELTVKEKLRSNKEYKEFLNQYRKERKCKPLHDMYELSRKEYEPFRIELIEFTRETDVGRSANVEGCVNVFKEVKEHVNYLYRSYAVLQRKICECYVNGEMTDSLFQTSYVKLSTVLTKFLNFFVRARKALEYSKSNLNAFIDISRLETFIFKDEWIWVS